eukprot:5662452-Amphidinium_carterae.1
MSRWVEMHSRVWKLTQSRVELADRGLLLHLAGFLDQPANSAMPVSPETSVAAIFTSPSKVLDVGLGTFFCHAPSC